MTISNLNTDKIKSSELASKVNELIDDTNSNSAALSSVGSLYEYQSNYNNVIWSTQGQIGGAILVDDQVFYTSKKSQAPGGSHYQLHQVSLDGTIERCIHNGTNWKDGISTSTGHGYRASLFANWNSANNYVQIFAQWENRVEAFYYDRANKTCGTPFHVAGFNGGHNFFGRDFYITGVSGTNQGIPSNIYCAISYPHGTWNNINHYPICRMYFLSSNGAHYLYNGDVRYLGSNTDESIRANDGSYMYQVGNTNAYYLVNAGAGPKTNRAFYIFDYTASIMHRFIVPANGANTTADSMWNLGHTSIAPVTAQLTFDKSFHIPALVTAGNSFYCKPSVQFDEDGNEVGIAAGTVTDDSYYRLPYVRILGWNPAWGTGKP